LERFAPSDPITLEEHFRIASYLDAQLEPLFAVLDRHWPSALVGCAGSFDSLAALVAHERGQELAANDTTLAITLTEFDPVKDRLLQLTAQQRALLPGLPDYRVHTIPFALIAIERVLMQGIETIHWSKYALKEGAAVRG
jgi:exopolyphosphatase / guanosine-5'-triphosphate,3'-diphosphate pyrophosphatase